MTKAEWKRIMLRQIGLKVCVCYLCCKPIKKDKELSLDHVVSKSQGGSDTPDNWMPTHKDCNSTKGGLTYEQYKVWKRLNNIRTGVER